MSVYTYLCFDGASDPSSIIPGRPPFWSVIYVPDRCSFLMHGSLFGLSPIHRLSGKEKMPEFAIISDMDNCLWSLGPGKQILRAAASRYMADKKKIEIMPVTYVTPELARKWRDLADEWEGIYQAYVEFRTTPEIVKKGEYILCKLYELIYSNTRRGIKWWEQYANRLPQ